MSFFEELKCRNVFRVGIIYAVTARVFIRLLSVFLPFIESRITHAKTGSAKMGCRSDDHVANGFTEHTIRDVVVAPTTLTNTGHQP